MRGDVGDVVADKIGPIGATAIHTLHELEIAYDSRL